MEEKPENQPEEMKQEQPTDTLKAIGDFLEKKNNSKPKEIKIDKKFSKLIHPISAKEKAELEKSILAEGCRDSIVIWNDIILDGHNRYKICKEHDLPYLTLSKYFDTEKEAIEWVIRNQLGRRNLTKYQRGVLALKLKKMIETKAKEKQIKGGKTKVHQTLEEPILTNKIVGEEAGVSSETIRKIETIEEKGSPELKQDLEENKITISKAYKKVTKTEPENIETKNESETKPEDPKPFDQDEFDRKTRDRNRSCIKMIKEVLSNEPEDEIKDLILILDLIKSKRIHTDEYFEELRNLIDDSFRDYSGGGNHEVYVYIPPYADDYVIRIIINEEEEIFIDLYKIMNEE